LSLPAFGGTGLYSVVLQGDAAATIAPINSHIFPALPAKHSLIANLGACATTGWAASRKKLPPLHFALRPISTKHPLRHHLETLRPRPSQSPAINSNVTQGVVQTTLHRPTSGGIAPSLGHCVAPGLFHTSLSLPPKVRGHVLTDRGDCLATFPPLCHRHRHRCPFGVMQQLLLRQCVQLPGGNHLPLPGPIPHLRVATRK